MAKVVKKYEPPVEIVLHIPEIGDRIALTDDWTFTVHDEYRNSEFNEAVSGIKDMRKSEAYVEKFNKTFPNKLTDIWKTHLSYISNNTHINSIKNMFRQMGFDQIPPEFDINELKAAMPTVTIPAGTTIVVDRIYIRKGVSDYSSITFRIENFPIAKKNHRVWVKLGETRTIKGNIEHIIK